MDREFALPVIGYWPRRYRQSGEQVAEPGFVTIGVIDPPGQVVTELESDPLSGDICGVKGQYDAYPDTLWSAAG